MLQGNLLSQVETRRRRKDGSLIDVSLSTAAMRSATGDIIGAMGIIADITERKQAEEALRDAKESAEGLLAALQDGLSVLDARGVHVYVNSAFCEMTGFSKEELIGVGMPHPYWPPEELEEIERALQKAKRGHLQDFELTFLRKNGERFPVIMSPSCTKDQQGVVVHYFATFKDITQRKLAEEALRETTQTLQALVQASPLAILTMDLQGDVRTWSPAAERTFGWSEQEALGRPNPIIPEDRQNEFRALLDAVVQGNLLSQVETRRRRKDGSLIDVSLSTAAMRNATGDIVGAMAIIADITERKQAEEALRQSEERLRSVMTNAPVILFGVDHEGLFTLAEGKGLTALGVNPDEHIGLSVFNLYRDVPEIIETARRALAGEAFTTTARVEELVFEAHVAPVRDHDGRITGAIAVATDITERKQAEETLRESAEIPLLAENLIRRHLDCGHGLELHLISPLPPAPRPGPGRPSRRGWKKR